MSDTAPHLEIAHVLFVDIVGYSKRLINEQRALIERLNRLVRSTEQFRQADAAGKLISIPTGDGMALAFFTAPDAPVRCAIELSKADQDDPKIELRIGIHSGPVDRLGDVNQRMNVAGAGINMAQRVMDCGDASHILLSNRVADDLAQYGQWRPYLHDLGDVEVKHGDRLGIVNFYSDTVGNPAVPAKVASQIAKHRRTALLRRRKLAVIGVAAAVLVAAIAGLLYQRVQRQHALANASDKSIAVLPLQNLSGDESNAYLADGIHDDILTNLTKVGDLKVISRSSVMQYRGNAAARNLREIAQALGVQTVLEGSVRRDGNRVLVNVQLIDATNDKHIWAERYDRTVADTIGLQGELAAEIATALRAKLAPQESARLALKPTKNADAYLVYLKARQREPTMHSREDGIEVDQLYSQAFGLDPTFVVAIARASMLNSKMFLIGRDPSRKARARTLADRALRLSPDLGEAHLALGLCFYRIDNDYEAALRELAIAAANLPNDPEVLEMLGQIYLHQGRWREALPNLQRAQDLDPQTPHSYLAATYRALRDWPAAAAAYQRLQRIGGENEPSNVWARVDFAYVELFRTGNIAAGKAILDQIAPGVDPNAAVTLARWDFAMFERNFDAAEQVLAEYPSEEFPPPMRDPKVYFRGCVALARGDTASAQTFFEKARPFFELRVHDHPDDPVFLAPLAELYAFMGRKEDAINASRRAVELVPASKNAAQAPDYATILAIVYAWTGEVDQSMAMIEPLLSAPGGIILAELRLRWEWDPLRANPRFKTILEQPEPKTIY
jgi:TolB-like protein/Flp pilus assembly protein TadD